MQPSEGITQLLIDWEKGDQGALEKLMPLVYSELRRLASNYLRRERGEHTLQPTALVNEAYFKAGRSAKCEMAESSPFFRNFRAVDAPDPGGPRTPASGG